MAEIIWMNEMHDLLFCLYRYSQWTPVGVHSGPHYPKYGDPRPVWRMFHNGDPICPHWNGGSYVPILEWWVFTSHSRGWNMNERTNEWIHGYERHNLEKHGLTSMKRNKNYWNYSKYIELNHSTSIKPYKQISVNTFHNVLNHVGMMGLH